MAEGFRNDRPEDVSQIDSSFVQSSSQYILGIDDGLSLFDTGSSNAFVGPGYAGSSPWSMVHSTSHFHEENSTFGAAAFPSQNDSSGAQQSLTANDTAAPLPNEASLSTSDFQRISGTDTSSTE